MTTLVTSVLGTLLVAGIFALTKSRWLYLVVPKIYLNTPLSSGHVVSLTLKNGGLATEEEIRIRLKSTCKYEFLGSSNSAVTYATNTVSAPKLPRFQTITVLLLVEGKTFEQSDVETVESKQAIGKVVEKLENAISPWQHLVVWPIVLLFLTVPFVFGTFVGKEAKASAFDYVSEWLDRFTPSKQLAGFTVSSRERYTFGTLAKATTDGRIKINISEILQHGDTIKITGAVENNMKQTLVLDYLKATSSAGDRGPLSFRDTRLDDVFIAASSSKRFQVKVYLPESSPLKEIELTYSLKSSQDSMNVEQRIVLK